MRPDHRGNDTAFLSGKAPFQNVSGGRRELPWHNFAMHVFRNPI
jgi:hypothetical protein